MIQRRNKFSVLLGDYLRQRSVRSLLLFVLAFTLVPVFLISFGQAYIRLAKDREVVRQSITVSLALSIDQGRNIISLSEQALINLADREDVSKAESTCKQSLAIAQIAMPLTTNLARVSGPGLVMCSAHPILMNPDLRNRAWLPELVNADVISFAGPAVEKVSGKSVLIVGLGLRKSAGGNDGHILAGIDLKKLETMLQGSVASSGAHIALVEPAGTRIPTSTAGDLSESKNPFDLKISALKIGSVAVARDKSGQQWTYARATLVPGHLDVVYMAPDAILYSSTFRHVATDIALPLIALTLAVAGLWFAIQFWAISPIESLRSLAKQYAAGKFEVTPPQLAYVPVEMNELRDELVFMAKRSTQRDDFLKDVADQKNLLVTELHHRVRNNLQIIISLVSLQTRQADTQEQKSALDRLNARIAALALVQRIIVDADDRPTVGVDLLLEEMCSLIRRTHLSMGDRVRLRFESDPIQISTDMANPLMLFAFEAVTNSYRHAFNDNRQGDIFVRFSADESGAASLNINDTGTGWNEEAKRNGTGHKLLQAFTRQLGGRLTLTTSVAKGSSIGVNFIFQPLLSGISRPPPPAFQMEQTTP